MKVRTISNGLMVIQLLIRRHWPIVLLALVLLWLMPPIWLAFAHVLNAWARILEVATGFVLKMLDNAKAFFKLSDKAVEAAKAKVEAAKEKAKEVAAKVAVKVAETPGVVWIVIVPLFKFFPKTAATIAGWVILDSLKKPFTGKIDLYPFPAVPQPPKPKG
jgi:hypothetical protein